MSTNNKVFQVLVTKGDQALAVAGTKVDALADGQLGIFDANTNLAVSGAVKKFYLAVGVDSDGDGTIDDIVTSAGQEVQSENVKDFTYKPHTAARDMVVEIRNYDNIGCDTEYGIKFEFRNAQIYARQGYNQFTKTFVVKTACCDGTTNESTPLELTQKFLEALNADESGMFKAEPVTGGATLTVTSAPTTGTAADMTVTVGATPITVSLINTDTTAEVATKIANAINAAPIDAIAIATGTVVKVANVNFETEITVNMGTTGAVVSVSGNSSVINLDDIASTVKPGIRITTNSLAVNKFYDVNLKYYKPRTTVIVPSLIEGFNCTGEIVIVEPGKPEEGSGYDVRQKEYHAGGWNGKPGPYRASSAIGLALPGFEYFANDNVKYDQFHLVYDQVSNAGWGEYSNNLMTIVAIPAADTATRDAFATAMNIQLSSYGFETLVDDAAATSTDPTVVETTPPDSAIVDGIA